MHADLVESLANLKSFHRKDRHRPLFDISRQWVSKSMKEAAVTAGIAPARAHPHALRHTYGRNAVLERRKSPAGLGTKGLCTGKVLQGAIGANPTVMGS